MARILRSIVFALGLALVGYAVWNLGVPQTHPSTGKEFMVELRDDGFHPDTITVAIGDTIRFTTTRKKYFWPASDPHPIHTDYPAFDPKEPIPPDKSWSFQFQESGTWKFHDHLAPYFTGTVTVLPKTSAENVRTPCSIPDSTECWESALITTLNTQGLAPTFTQLAALYETNPQFADSCHQITHDLGNAAYRLYEKDKNSVFAANSIDCAAGFYHGFMEGFLASGETVEAARDFCKEVGSRLSGVTPDAELQCFHGIGHGVIEQSIARGGNAPAESITARIAAPLALCEKASENIPELYRCTSGIFNGVANYESEGKYGFSINESDPFTLCHDEPDRYKESCYGNMNSLMFVLGKGDFKKALGFAISIKDASYRIASVRYVGGMDYIFGGRENPQHAVSVCHALKEPFNTPCMEGIVQGFLEHGTPGKQHTETMALCHSPFLEGGERTTCFRYFLTSLHGWYGKEKSDAICASADTQYQKYCNGKNS